MEWQRTARKAAMGQFVRVKAERMVIIRFDGEPTQHVGKSFKGEPIDELHFPVTFWDERSVGMKYKENEAARLVQTTNGEVKVMSISSPPLLRAILEEDEDESIMGRIFIISHTGTAKDTIYKLREVVVRKQKPLITNEEEEESEEEEQDGQLDTIPTVGPHPKKDLPVRPHKRDNLHPADVPTDTKEIAVKPKTRKRKAPVIEEDEQPTVKRVLVENGQMVVQPKADTDDPEKTKFVANVKKRAAKVKPTPVSQDPPDEPIDDDEDNFPVDDGY